MHPPVPVASARLYPRLFGCFKPHLRVFVLASVTMTLVGVTEPVLPWLLKILLENEFADRTAAAPMPMWLIPLLLVALFVVRGFLAYFGKVGVNWVAHRVVLDLRREMFGTIVELPAAFYDEHPAGEIVSKFTFDATQVSQAVIRVLDVIVKDTVAVTALLLFLLYLNWQLAAVALLVTPPIAFIVARVSRRMRQMSLRLQSSVGDINEVTQEAIAGQHEVKIFAGQRYEVDRFAEVANTVRKLQMKVIRAASAKVPLIQLIMAVGIAAAIYIAMLAIDAGYMRTEDFVAFIAAVVLLLPPTRRLTAVNEFLQRGLAAAQSVFRLIDEPREQADAGIVLESVRGDLRFDAVSFRYPRGDRPALSDITLAIAAGQSVALVGPSGAGKSTLAKLVPRFYDPTGGRILLDGRDISAHSLSSLRRHIALVGQQVVLFNDTLYNNIAYGAMRGAPRERVLAAARAAHVIEFADQLPHGIDTIIGADGVRLSGGQRQRLAIARALLKDAPILILDEATSALDAEVERQIQDGLARLRAGRTSLIVAHRLSTIESADLIVVLAQGRIVEVGTHGELLAAGGDYARLYRHQFRP